MRILHILDHSIPHQTGYAIRTQAILKEQRKIGWETFQLTGPKQGLAIANEEIVDGWEFNRTAPPSGMLDGLAGLAEIEQMGEITYRIEKVVKRVRPHVLHAHSPVLNAIPALRVGRRIGTPVVYQVRAFWEDAAVASGKIRENSLRYRLSRSLEKWALRRADAVIASSTALCTEIAACGVGPEKITVIANGTDIKALAGNSEPDIELKQRLGLSGSLVLGFIGTFHEYEGLEVLLRALPEILSLTPQVRVLLLGNGPQEVRLKRLAIEAGIAGNVVFSGPVPRSDLPRYYDLIDMVVHPRLSVRHTELVVPLKVLDAMARGGLVVASNVGGHRELIHDGIDGVLFRAGDPRALATAVVNLVNSPARWPALKAAARHFVETERGWEASVARYANVYARIGKQ